jgi:Pyruvate/2-oxoacid:ferredoxin oxidoreductase gamma subunit
MVDDGASKDAEATLERRGGRTRAETRISEKPSRSSLLEMGEGRVP